MQAGLKPASADDSSVAIIKKQGLNGVKIQLNLNEQVLAEESETELSNHEEDFVEPPCPEEELVCGQKLVKNASEKVEKRKYTLEELEVEGFAESTSSSAKNSDFEEEEVDLNSLIEGDVDEIDEDLLVAGRTNFRFPKLTISLCFFLKKDARRVG